MAAAGRSNVNTFLLSLLVLHARTHDIYPPTLTPARDGYYCFFFLFFHFLSTVHNYHYDVCVIYALRVHLLFFYNTCVYVCTFGRPLGRRNDGIRVSLFRENRVLVDPFLAGLHYRVDRTRKVIIDRVDVRLWKLNAYTIFRE